MLRKSLIWRNGKKCFLNLLGNFLHNHIYECFTDMYVYTDDVCCWLLLLTQGGDVVTALRADMLPFLSIVYNGWFFAGCSPANGFVKMSKSEVLVHFSSSPKKYINLSIIRNKVGMDNHQEKPDTVVELVNMKYK